MLTFPKSGGSYIRLPNGELVEESAEAPDPIVIASEMDVPELDSEED